MRAWWIVIEPAGPVSLTAPRNRTRRAPGRSRRRSSPASSWWSRIGPWWLPGITISGPLVVVDVVEHDADRRQVVVGVRVERPVLVPLDRRAVARGLEVELADVEADRGSPELLEHRQDVGMRDHAGVALVPLVRRLDPAHPRLGRRVAVLEIVDLVVRWCASARSRRTPRSPGGAPRPRRRSARWRRPDSRSRDRRRRLALRSWPAPGH